MSSFAETVTANTSLKVYFGPELIANPYEERYAYIERPLNISCPIIGYPLNIQWTFIRAYNESTFTIDTNENDLHIASYDRIQHEGIYICRAETEFKLRLLSADAKPPSLTKPFDDKLSVNIGDNLIFKCECLLCGPIDTVQWYRNNEKLPENCQELTSSLERVELKLRISNIGESDEGLYSCRMKNEFGIEEISISVNVLNDEFENSSSITCNLSSSTFSITKSTNYQGESILSLDNGSSVDTDLMKANAKFYDCQSTTGISLLVAGEMNSIFNIFKLI